jgi:hypothetical protein
MRERFCYSTAHLPHRTVSPCTSTCQTSSALSSNICTYRLISFILSLGGKYHGQTTGTPRDSICDGLDARVGNWVCQQAPPPANPISVSCTQTGPIPCTGSVNAQFTASHAGGKAITISDVSATSTGPNSDCAKCMLLPDSDTRPDVIDQVVRVNCGDCTPGQTITVVISVVDNNGNVNFAWCTITT